MRWFGFRNHNTALVQEGESNTESHFILSTRHLQPPAADHSDSAVPSLQFGDTPGMKRCSHYKQALEEDQKHEQSSHRSAAVVIGCPKTVKIRLLYFL